ncbi:MAG TPA: hypothetical protein VMR95_02110 [Candidatus Binatia bacterium]|nr:hypothetical protein [Candidatus Binatia bacterium]
MYQLKKNEKGFSFVEALIIIVVLALIGAAGLLVHKDHDKASTTSTTVIKTAAYSLVRNTKTSEETYTDLAAKASFSFPSNWSFTKIEGLCDLPGCSASSNGITAVELTSPDKGFDVVWSGVEGIGGGACYESSGCPYATVFSSTPIPKSPGLYVVVAAVQYDNSYQDTEYTPIIAVQDSSGIIKTGSVGGSFYQIFNSPVNSRFTEFSMINGYKDGGVGYPSQQEFSIISSAQAYLSSSDAKQIQQILLSLKM